MGKEKGEMRKEKDHAEFSSVYVYTHLTYLSINIGERRKEKGEITMRDFKAPASFSFLLSHF
jgi:hypothetical protein